MKPHIHEYLIEAWTNGAKIQRKVIKRGKKTLHDLIMEGRWIDECNPMWSIHEEYRIKPEPKPDFNKHYLVFANRIYSEEDMLLVRGWIKPNLKLTFNGETGDLKSAEVLK